MSSEAKSDIRVGDKYRLVGINDEKRSEEDPTIFILGLLTDGRLMYMLVSGKDHTSETILYSEALVMLEQGIWKEES